LKTEILGSYRITKEMILKKLKCTNLSQHDIDECLDIICAIKEGCSVFNIITNDGNYLLYVKNNKSKWKIYLLEKKRLVKMFISGVLAKMLKMKKFLYNKIFD